MSFLLGAGTEPQEIESVSTTLTITPGNGHLIINGTTLAPAQNNVTTLGTSTSIWSAFHVGVINAQQLNVDNLRLDGNTISSTNTNGNIILDANGTGNIVMSDVTRPNTDDTRDLGTSALRWMDGFFSASVRVGDTLTVTSSDRLLISGETNTISSSNNGFITGLSNTLSSCTEGAVVGGTGNVVSGGIRSVAVGGNGLRVAGCNHSVALGGNGNSLTNSASNSVIVGGQANTMNTASRAAIIAGFQNSMTGTCTHSVLIGGQNGAVSGASEAVVLKTGSTSRTYSTGNQIYLDSVTISSYGHVLPNANDTLDIGSSSLRWRTIRADTSVLVTDGTGTFSLNNQSAAVGSSITLFGADYSMIVGTGNVMNTVVEGFMTGTGNQMVSANTCAILAGRSNVINNNTPDSCIIGARSCTISTNSTAGNNVIVGGRNVNLTSTASNVVVIKGSSTARTISTGGIHLDGASTCYGNVTPQTTNTFTMGSSSLRWSTVFGVNFNASGTATLASVDIDGGTIDGTTIGGTTPAVGTFTQVNVDNLRLDGNTLSSTDTNGNIILDANGTGNIVCNDVIRPNTDDSTDLGSTTQRWSNIHASASVRVGDTFSIGSGVDRYALIGVSHNIANSNTNSLAVGTSCTLNGNGNNMVVGSSHRLVSSAAAVIVGGNGSSITNTSTNAGIFAGSGHIINGCLRACIISGANNSITNSSTDSVLIGGANGTINGSNRVIVLKTNGTTRTYTTSEVHLDGPTQCYGGIYPNANNSHPNGTSSLRWSTVYGVNFNASGTATLATVDIDGGAIDGTTIGASVAAVGTFTQVNVDNLRLDGNTLSSTNTNGDIIFDANGTGNIICSDTLRANTDASTDFGSSTVRWLDGYFSRRMRIGNINSATGARVLAVGDSITVASNDSAVVGGTTNQITGGTQSVICGGLQSTINSTRAFIGGGQQHTITNTATQSAILGGFNSTINGSLRAGIVAGNAHTITNSSTHSVIVGGTSGTISGATAAVVIKGGTTSRTYSTSNQIYLDSGTIQCYGNVYPDTDISYNLGTAGQRWLNVVSRNALIGSSLSNTGNRNFLVGETCSITSSAVNSMIVGKGCTISTTLTSNVIIGCETSRIIESGGGNNSTNAVIIGGANGVIEGTNNCVLVNCSGSGSSFTLSTNGRFLVNCSNHARFNCDIRPEADATYNLGSAALQWNNIFSANAVTVSDARLKEDVTPLTTGLDTLLQLQPVSFVWKNPNLNTLSKKQFGFIAQDVEAVEPGLIRKPTDYAFDPDDVKGDTLEDKLQERELDYRSLTYNGFIPLLVNSIKELKQLVDSQQQQITALQAEVAALKAG